MNNQAKNDTTQTYPSSKQMDELKVTASNQTSDLLKTDSHKKIGVLNGPHKDAK